MKTQTCSDECGHFLVTVETGEVGQGGHGPSTRNPTKIVSCNCELSCHTVNDVSQWTLASIHFFLLFPIIYFPFHPPRHLPNIHAYTLSQSNPSAPRDLDFSCRNQEIVIKMRLFPPVITASVHVIRRGKSFLHSRNQTLSVLTRLFLSINVRHQFAQNIVYW